VQINGETVVSVRDVHSCVDQKSKRGSECEYRRKQARIPEL
jgi:hypothetical protein